MVGVQCIDKIVNFFMIVLSWKFGYYFYVVRLYGLIGSGFWCVVVVKKDEYLQVDLGI